MNVLHFSAANESTGAGRATLLTHYALLDNKIASKVLFLKSQSCEPEIYSYHSQNLISKFRRATTTVADRLPLLVYPKRKTSIFSPGLVGVTLKDNELLEWADVIHIHWANHGFIDIAEIAKWNKPIVWTLRDMWPFTGGCHQAFECENFKYQCGTCPALGSTSENDLSRVGLQRKLKFLPDLGIKWVAISSWIRSQAKASTLLKHQQIEVIHSAVNGSIFKLLDQKTERLKLQLPLHTKIILMGAGNIREHYKGFEYAVRALNQMDPNILVATFGSGYFLEGEIPQRIIHFGELSYVQLSELYSAADIFLGPSVAEAMGKTFLEAQLCGLPVVCFDQTGPVDIVEHLETGYLSNFKDDKDLLAGVEFCLTAGMSREKIQLRARKLFDINQMVRAYVDIYEKSILDWSNSTSRGCR